MKVSITLAAISLLLVGVLIHRTESKKQAQLDAMREGQPSIYEVPVLPMSVDDALSAGGQITQR